MLPTYGTLALVKGEWRIEAEPHVVMRAKRIFGRLKSRTADTLTLSTSAETARDLEWFESRYPLEMSAADRATLTAAAAGHREMVTRLSQLIDGRYTPPTFALARPPRDYQTRAAHIALETGGLLVADDVGKGKTITAICAMLDPRTLPAIVVTLTALPPQWRDRLEEFAPDLDVHLIRKGTPYPLPQFMGHGPDVVILNYHKLAGWAHVLGAYGRMIVFDEIQELRHDGTYRYQAAEAIARRMHFRIGLSATPTYNYGGEIYPVLNLLRPGCLGTHGEFYAEWCTGDASGKTKLKDPTAFGTWARSEFLMTREVRARTADEEPQRIVHTVQGDGAALAKVEADAARLANIILTATPLPKGARFQAAERLTSLLRQATGIAKAPEVADLVRLLVENGERVVLCGWHREVYDIWRAKLRDLNPVLFTGTESAAEKDRSKQAFVRGESQVLIMSLRSAVGVDGLQGVCSVMVMGELDWSPYVMDQNIGRLDRDGQPKQVLVYFCVSDKGADPTIAEMLGLKREQGEGIRNPGRPILDRIDTSGEHVRRLAVAYLRQRKIAVPELLSAAHADTFVPSPDTSDTLTAAEAAPSN